jgi:hypothetical protein
MTAASVEPALYSCPTLVVVQRRCRIALIVIGAVIAATLLAHFAVLVWAENELTPVESIVALHSNMLATGSGLYYDLNHYPFTVSPYGPIFYGTSAILHRLGLPLFQGGRLLSFAALLGSFWFLWRTLKVLVTNPDARAAGLILAASTANVLFWGTVGQTDMLAVCFSLGAFANCLDWREHRAARSLLAAGVFALLAIFTKQTSLAAATAIGVWLLFEDRRIAVGWIAGVAGAGTAVAFALNSATHGHYFQNAIYANINPLSVDKLVQHVRYFVLTCGGLLVVIAAGVRRGSRRLMPLYLYTLLAAGIWLATAPKIGSDLNYQIETMLLLALCAACALDRLEYFPKLFRQDRGWVTLLNIPLLLHVVLNVVLTGNVLASRVLMEPQKAAESAALMPYLQPRGRVLTSQFNALVHSRGRMEVEPLIYTLLVDAGRVDPGPVLRDLSSRQFARVIIGQDVFTPNKAAWDNQETLSLPAAHLEALRANYRLVAHVPGAYLEGDYIYEPRQD